MYKVLQIEDIPSDAYLVRREVRKAIDPCEFLIVDTKDAFLKALEEFNPDLIISDFSMPGFDWNSALRLAQKIAPGTPFIIVTGSTSEAIGVECLKAGATDFISKDFIEKLAPAVQKILK